MFSLISKLADFILGDSDTLDSDQADRSKHEPNIDQFPVTKDIPFFIKKPETVNSRSVQGKVTHMFHGHGLIDGEIYFAMSDVQEEHTLQVDDKVQVKAVQHDKEGGWYAEDICVIHQTWETQMKLEPQEIDLGILQSAVVLGSITFFRNGAGKIDKEIDFDLEDCKEDYIPMRGDWVAANVSEKEMEADDGDEWTSNVTFLVKRAYNVYPARHRNIEGSISAVMTDHGYIDGEIFFNRAACLNGYKPRKGDTVKAIAIESTQGKCEWRAVSIVPMSSESSAYCSKQYRAPAKQTGGSWLIPGQRPKSFQPKVILPVKLPHFTVPDNLEAAVLRASELTDVAPYLMQELQLINYVKRLSTLIYLEEIQMQMDIREFDMNRVCLYPVREFLALTVPGLAEGRPSILIGDKIILSSPSDPDGPNYEGYVHEMTCTDVHLKFSPEFHARYNGEDYDVEFTFSRTPLRRCHQAVSLAVQCLGSKVLFPLQVEMKAPQVKLEDIVPTEDVIFMSPECMMNSDNGNTNQNSATASEAQHHHQAQETRQSSTTTVYSSQDIRSKEHSLQHSKSSRFSDSKHYSNNKMNKRKKFRFFNPRLNHKQQSAVRNILLGQARPMPYVIFGPPGTGKTITVVEAILQILTQVPSSRIMACTPSNSAADLIAERLHLSGAVEQTQMVRLNAFNRSVDNIPECILQYCRFAEDLQMISRYRVIVSTCTMAGALFGLGLSAGHITHIFIDECGQATEPESLIPVGLVAGADGQIVLAGDPKQLGPTIMSPFAKMYGLELSFLERLMLREPYQRNEELFADEEGFDSLLVTMLVNNYRSHPAILELPSRLFYYNQLQPFADPSLTHTLVKWNLLPTPDFPVIFHGTRGEDIREMNSPSWFNPNETVEVVRYLQGVLKEGVQPDDIGIITPYRKQVEKIRLMMDRLRMPDVKVGSVEEFQGQERQVIIISTVRSNEKLVGFDIRHTLGFLSNPKRFNVAITRAEALLIIIGNPYVLGQDPNWLTLIQYVADRGGYTGCDLPDFSAYESEPINPNGQEICEA